MTRLNATDQPSAPAGPPARPAHANGVHGFPLFRVFGIQIRLDWTWLIIFFVIVFVLQSGFQPTLEGQPDWAIWLLSAVSVIALFACVLAHELGHSLVAMRHGIQMFDITLFIFGGMARLRGEPRRPADELKIALAGPAVTVVLAAIFWAAWAGLHDALPIVVAEGLRYLASINTVLLIFNMIPGFPLDGGRVLRAIFWRASGNLLSATRTAAAVGKAFGGVLIVLGLVLMFNQFLVQGLLNIFLGWFLANAANQSVQHLQVRRMLEVFRVADAMQRNIVTVSQDMPLDRLVGEGFYRYHFKSFPVVEGRDPNLRFVGLVSLADVQRVPPGDWPATTAGHVLDAGTADWRVAADDGLYEAFRRMGEDDIGRLVVTDPAGRVIGMITRRDIMRFLQIYSGLQPLAGRPPVAGSSPPQAIPLADPAPSPGPSGPAPLPTASPADGDPAPTKSGPAPGEIAPPPTDGRPWASGSRPFRRINVTDPPDAGKR